jgi:RNase P subunit RPR2
MKSTRVTIATPWQAGRCDACGTWLEVGDEAELRDRGETMLCGLGCAEQQRINAERWADYEAWLDEQEERDRDERRAA